MFFPASVVTITLIVVVSSIIVPISTFCLVTVLPLEPFDFRFVTATWFNVPHWRRLFIEQVVHIGPLYVPMSGIIHCVLIVQSTVEWPEFRHIVLCDSWQNVRSSSFGRARCSAPIDIKELCLSIYNTRSMTWSIVLVWKSSTAHIVLRGSRRAARNTAFASSSGSALFNWLCGV